jgi:hypothetical protein
MKVYSTYSILPAFVLFLIICVGTYFARTNGWYYSYWYTDIVLHIISGMMFAALWIWFIHRRADEGFRFEIFTSIMFATFGSVLWEFWEFSSWKILPKISAFYIASLGDTLGDILCGMAGAAIYVAYVRIRKVLK